MCSLLVVEKTHKVLIVNTYITHLSSGVPVVLLTKYFQNITPLFLLGSLIFNIVNAWKYVNLLKNPK